MRIRIIRNKPPKDELNICSNITRYKDQEFDVLREATSGVFIDLNGVGTMLYKGEYELLG